MTRRLRQTLVALVILGGLIGAAWRPVSAQFPPLPPLPLPLPIDPVMTLAQIQQFMAQLPFLLPLMDQPNPDAAAEAKANPPNDFHEVSTHIFDPGDTDSVQAAWLNGIGCPNTTATDGNSSQEPVCVQADLSDEENEGLLLVKTGPTAQNSAAFAELKNVKGMTVTELGYDLRKAGTRVNARGSHCGAGSPRFNVTTTADTYFVGCLSPPPTETDGQAWIRLRWLAPVMAFSASSGLLVPISGTVKTILLLFDEGTDNASGSPDRLGAAFVDNIDVNGQLVGKGGGPGGRGGGPGGGPGPH
jgi:hypothetical protein